VVARRGLDQRFSFGGRGSMACMLARIGIVTVLSVACWHLFEKHFLKLKRLFEYDKSTPELALCPVLSETGLHGGGGAHRRLTVSSHRLGQLLVRKVRWFPNG